MDNEFRIQVRVSTVVLANIVIGLKRRGEVTAFRSANALVQAAMQIAENDLVMEGTEEQEIVSIDEAIEVLEETKLFNFNSSSANERAMFRGRRRESIEENRRDKSGGSREYNSRIRRRELSPEEIHKEVMRSPGMQEFLRQKNENVAEQQASIRKYTKEEIEYMNERGNRMDLPGLMPDPTRKEPDFVLGETQEEKMKRFKKADEMKLNEQYPQEQ
jgi:hypothetical protein